MFWQKIENQYRDLLAKKNSEPPPARWLKLFAEALPDPSITLAYWPRTAGTGSLGRPRWVGYGSWQRRTAAARMQGAGSFRLDARAWRRRNACASTTLPAATTARPTHGTRQPEIVLIRRLSPNNRKIDVADRRDASRLLHPDLLWAMGRDLAAVHLGVRDRRDAIRKDLAKRKQRWFRATLKRRRNLSPASTPSGRNPRNSVVNPPSTR